MIIKRTLTTRILQAAQEFPVIALVGPRQSGKTTLAQSIFTHHAYMSLEDHNMRLRAHADPKGFLQEAASSWGLINEQQPSLYFWRDKAGHEIDCIVDTVHNPVAVEIKSSQTIASDFFKEIMYWKKISDFSQVQSYLVYGGSQNQQWPEAHVVGWQSSGTLIEQITQQKES